MRHGVSYVYTVLCNHNFGFAGDALIIVEMLLPGLGAPGIGGAVLCVGGVLSMFNYIGWSVMWVVLGVLLILIGSLYFITSTNRKKKNPLILTSSINESDQASAMSFRLTTRE